MLENVSSNFSVASLILALVFGFALQWFMPKEEWTQILRVTVPATLAYVCFIMVKYAYNVLLALVFGSFCGASFFVGAMIAYSIRKPS